MPFIQKPLGTVSQKQLFVPQNRVKNLPVLLQNPSLSDTFQKQPLITPLFAGKRRTVKSFLHPSMMWLAMALGAVGGSTIKPFQSTAMANTETQPIQTTLPQETKPYTLTESDKKRYEEMENQFSYLETLPADSKDRKGGIEKLKKNGVKLKDDAIKGDLGARVILDALWVNRMFDEITHPNPNAIRINYDAFEKLSNQFKNGQLSREDFNTTVQKRAVNGLINYYHNNYIKNEFTQQTQRFFQPISKVLAKNPDEDIQKWGGAILDTCFSSFTPQQQTQYLQTVSEAFLTAKPGPQKLSALKSIHKTYFENKTLPFWKTFIRQVRNQLKNGETAAEANQQEELKYPIVLLGLLNDPELTTLIEPMMKPEAPLDTQRAIAWALGAVKSPKGIKHLTQIIENSAFHPLTREMALYSLEEYAAKNREPVLKTLTAYSQADAPTTPQNVIDAALAMIEKLEDKSESEPDFFIHKWLKTDPEKAEYRELRDKYIAGWQRLNIGQKNLIDRFLLPYRNLLAEIVSANQSHILIDGSIADHETFENFMGKRFDDGRLAQSILGVSAPLGWTVTSKRRLIPNVRNGFAHEATHHFHYRVLAFRKGMCDEIATMYQNALRDKRLIYRFAENNDREYLAVAGEASVIPYKAHSLMYEGIFNNGYDTGNDNTQSKLKRFDPKLYELLKSLQTPPTRTN